MEFHQPLSYGIKTGTLDAINCILINLRDYTERHWIKTKERCRLWWTAWRLVGVLCRGAVNGKGNGCTAWKVRLDSIRFCSFHLVGRPFMALKLSPPSSTSSSPCPSSAVSLHHLNFPHLITVLADDWDINVDKSTHLGSIKFDLQMVHPPHASNATV